jgi:hypothetical protein
MGSAPATSAGRRRERRLRRIVRRLDACLPAIDAAQRRVLTLRAGLGPAPARSRAQVAQRLGVRVGRVVRLERRGVRTLRRLDRATNCAPGAGPAPVTEGVSVLAGLGAPFGPAAASPVGGTTTVLAASGAPSTAAKASPGGGTRHDDPRAKGGVESASAEQPATLLPPAPGSGGDRTPVFVLIGLLVLLGFGFRALRATRS